jgi:hypothetical protein
MSFGGASGLERAHNGGSAVILTSQSVRSYVVGTPSPRRPDSTRTSRDWRAWLSHEVSSIELTSQEDLRIHEQYATPSKLQRHDSIRTSHTDHDDTTVVLRGSCDIETPRPDVELSVVTDARHVVEPPEAHGPPEQSMKRPETIIRISEKSTPQTIALEEGPLGHTLDSQDTKHGQLLRASPRQNSAPLLSRQRAPPIPRSSAPIAQQPAPETPKSPPMNERFPFLETGRQSSSNSLSSRHSRSPTDSIASTTSLTSPKSTPRPKAPSNVSAPATSETSQRVPTTALKRSDAQLKRKENITPPSIRSKTKLNVSSLSLSTRPQSQQPLSSSTLNRNTRQSPTKAPETDHARQQSSPAATPLRPRIRATIRPISPEKLARRPRSAFDLRGANGLGRPDINTASPRPGSELRRPALHVKTSSSSLAATKEPSPKTVDRVIDSVLHERSGSITPGQRMADRFLKERKSTPALEGSAGKVSLRGGLVLVREDTPAFL